MNHLKGQHVSLARRLFSKLKPCLSPSLISRYRILRNRHLPSVGRSPYDPISRRREQRVGHQLPGLLNCAIHISHMPQVLSQSTLIAPTSPDDQRLRCLLHHNCSLIHYSSSKFQDLHRLPASSPSSTTRVMLAIPCRVIYTVQLLGSNKRR